MTAPRGAPLTPGDLAGLAFDPVTGLLPAVVTDTAGGVRMLGYMNREALAETFRRGRVVFFSRRRRRLWEKGETSGRTLGFVEARADCDRDALWITARPHGPVCHQGTEGCFGDPRAPLAVLAELENLVARRLAERPPGSYTVRLADGGIRRVAQKVGEEGLETALAAVAENDGRLVAEAADLLYHLAVLLRCRGLGWEDVAKELRARLPPSG